MPESLYLIFSGLAGAILTAVVAWIIHRQSVPRPHGRAWEVLKGLNRVLGKQEGEVYFTRSGNDHYHVASYLYSMADGEVISTAFHEDPAQYGDGDIARNFKYGGSLVTRLTCAAVCIDESAIVARDNLNRLLPGSTFVVIPENQLFVRLDGMFCCFPDSTCLAFISFRNPTSPEKNYGIVFRDGMASTFFRYYRDLADLYKRDYAA